MRTQHNRNSMMHTKDADVASKFQVAHKRQLLAQLNSHFQDGVSKADCQCQKLRPLGKMVITLCKLEKARPYFAIVRFSTLKTLVRGFLRVQLLTLPSPARFSMYHPPSNDCCKGICGASPLV
jgi:hypothetical protein